MSRFAPPPPLNELQICLFVLFDLCTITYIFINDCRRTDFFFNTGVFVRNAYLPVLFLLSRLPTVLYRYIIYICTIYYVPVRRSHDTLPVIWLLRPSAPNNNNIIPTYMIPIYIIPCNEYD